MNCSSSSITLSATLFLIRAQPADEPSEILGEIGSCFSVSWEPRIEVYVKGRRLTSTAF
jgi:hypothetical protein